MIRHVCALGAVLGLFVQGSSGGHMLLVAHTRCAEHGELVHEGGVHHHETVGHAETDAAAVRDASDTDVDEAHEHCALSVDRRDACGAVDDSRLLARIADAPEDFTPTHSFVVSKAKRFQIAPKNSPPA